MRTLDAALITELGLTVTRPGYLVSIGFSTPQYFSTLGDVSFDSKTWYGASLKVEGLQRATKTGRTAMLRFGDSDHAIAALVLNEGIADRAISIYSVYAGAPTHAVLELNAVGDACEIGDLVGISVIEFATVKAKIPRRRISADTGFNYLIPSGSGIFSNGSVYWINR